MKGKAEKITKKGAGITPIRANQIIVIRHAQKPTKKPRLKGILENGRQDPESLTVRGWQHAGALAAAFGIEEKALSNVHIARPDFIFAAGTGKKKARNGSKKVTLGSHSKRPQQTISLMAAKLELTPVIKFSKGEEDALVQDVLDRKGTILICWQHQDIAAIGNLIMGNKTTVPQTWAQDRYDLVYVFDRVNDGWSFRQFFHERLMPS